jgi:hypothetical protein
VHFGDKSVSKHPDGYERGVEKDDSSVMMNLSMAHTGKANTYFAMSTVIIDSPLDPSNVLGNTRDGISKFYVPMGMDGEHTIKGA